MKVLISVDIEGVTGINVWNETELDSWEHAQFREQMTRETLAACEGAIEAGATEILVKDAHDSARNIDMTKLPKSVRLSRGWTNSPDAMFAGIDETYDAVICVGYHSAAGRDGNPLAHTITTRLNYIKVNGELASEFLLNSYIAAGYGVPVVFISGDKMICHEAKKFNPGIETVAVSEGVGGATVSINPDYACELIKEGVKKSLSNIPQCSIPIPESFDVEICYKDHKDAKKASYYPGAASVSPHVISFKANNVEELKTSRLFIL